jgi:hypothetical protein
LLANNGVALAIDSSKNFDFKAGTVTTTGSGPAEVGTNGAKSRTISAGGTVAVGDCGRLIYVSGGNVAVPSLFEGFHCIIVNNSGGAISLTESSSALYIFGAGFGSHGTRTLAASGMAYIIAFNGGGTYGVSGPGVT